MDIVLNPDSVKAKNYCSVFSAVTKTRCSTCPHFFPKYQPESYKATGYLGEKQEREGWVFIDDKQYRRKMKSYDLSNFVDPYEEEE